MVGRTTNGIPAFTDGAGSFPESLYRTDWHHELYLMLRVQLLQVVSFKDLVGGLRCCGRSGSGEKVDILHARHQRSLRKPAINESLRLIKTCAYT